MEQDPNPVNSHSTEDIEAYILELENSKNDLAHEGKYDQADGYKTKIQELKKNLQIKKSRYLEIQHSSELENLESSYKRDIDDLNTEWDKKFKEFEERSLASEENLNQKHIKEMEELYNFLEQKLPKNVKYSKEYLRLKAQEEILVKQQNYKEAGVIQKKRELQEKNDTEKWNKEKTEKIKSQSVKTAHKHLMEKNSMKKKLDIQLDVMKKERQIMIDQITHKYQNKKFDLDLHQKKERMLNENENLLKKTSILPKTRKYHSVEELPFSSTKIDSGYAGENSEGADRQVHSNIDMHEDNIVNEA